MKYISLIFSVLLVLVSCGQFNKTNDSYIYLDGRRIQFVDTILHGGDSIFFVTNSSDTDILSGQYLNDLMEGVWINRVGDDFISSVLFSLDSAIGHLEYSTYGPLFRGDSYIISMFPLSFDVCVDSIVQFQLLPIYHPKYQSRFHLQMDLDEEKINDTLIYSEYGVVDTLYFNQAWSKKGDWSISIEHSLIDTLNAVEKVISTNIYTGSAAKCL